MLILEDQHSPVLFSGEQIPTERKEWRGNTTMEDNTNKPEQEETTPLTDEEFAEFQKKEKRKDGIIFTILDFILDFFR